MISASTTPDFYGGPYNIGSGSPAVWGTSDTGTTAPPAFPHATAAITPNGNPTLYAWVTN